VSIEIRRLDRTDVWIELDRLAAILADGVANGDSVSFLDGLTHADARSFFESLVPELERGTRVLLAAYDGDDLVGCVQLVHAWPPNSQHRADVAKLIVDRSARGRGVGRALMERLEEEARTDGKSLLILDTVAGSVADGLYERLGWTRLGVVPNYAQNPGGVLCDAAFFYKHL
jgi:ribosomal protein S18 acetylase RimI-like enzyme